jgi:hypothetical protein
MSTGWVAGPVFIAIYIMALILSYILPIGDIDEAIDFPCQEYVQRKHEFGKHSF